MAPIFFTIITYSIGHFLTKLVDDLLLRSCLKSFSERVENTEFSKINFKFSSVSQN